MEVGKFTYGEENIRLRFEQAANLKIGKFCSIADNVVIWLGGNHRSDRITTYPFGSKNNKIFHKFDGAGHPKTNGDVIIGNDVWIGSNVTIMSSIKIGDGSVIGNNSHVIKNVKPYSVVGGNPAEFYYFRFDDITIKKLLELKWWDFEDTMINDISPLLCSDDPDKFEILFKTCEKLKNEKL